MKYTQQHSSAGKIASQAPFPARNPCANPAAQPGALSGRGRGCSDPAHPVGDTPGCSIQPVAGRLRSRRLPLGTLAHYLDPQALIIPRARKTCRASVQHPTLPPSVSQRKGGQELWTDSANWHCMSSTPHMHHTPTRRVHNRHSPARTPAPARMARAGRPRT